jgi:thioredoxin reductase (NADPH)
MDFNLTDFTPKSSKDNPDYGVPVKVLIIGSGPAGLSAALYAARAQMEPVVLAGMELGGQVSLTHIVENYPGFPEGIGGPELVEQFQKQAERFGATVEYDTAVEVDLSERPFRVRTYNTEYLADSLIISTGATPLHLNIPGESEFTGRGVSYCATCDGWFFKDKDVIVVGGGDSAMEEGIFLTRFAKSVTIVHRRDELRAGAILQKRAFDNPKVKFQWNTVLKEIHGDDGVVKVLLEDTQTGKQSELPIDGVFIFIGHAPNTQLFANQLDMDDRQYLIVNNRMHTNIQGVYAAGEVADPHFRQVITSAGMGAAAAMEAIHYLEAEEAETTEEVLAET